MSDEMEIQAFVDLPPETVAAAGPASVGPAPRVMPLAEHRQPAFYRVHYLKNGRPHVAWRVADSDKRAVDLVIYSHDPPARVIRVARFADRQELIDNVPPGRSIRCLFPPADLKLAHSLGLLTERDITA